MPEERTVKLNDIERVTLACSLSMFLDTINKGEFKDEEKFIAPLVACLSVASIIKKLNISAEMEMFEE